MEPRSPTFIEIVCKDGNDSHIVGLSIKITLAKVMNSGPIESRISGKHQFGTFALQKCNALASNKPAFWVSYTSQQRVGTLRIG